MNKKELSSRVAEVLRANNIRKPVSVKKQTLHITDEGGNTAEFHIKQQDKNVLYTVDDATNVIDACIAVIIDAIKNGEEISIVFYLDETFTLSDIYDSVDGEYELGSDGRILLRPSGTEPVMRVMASVVDLESLAFTTN